ncbi:MAG: KH domain-containing protein [Bradymonadaceae bacterium]
MADQSNDDEILELVRFMVSSIIGEEVDIDLETEVADGELRIDVRVPSEHRGRIIGRHGRVARSMRNVLTASRFDRPERIKLDIVD